MRKVTLVLLLVLLGGCASKQAVDAQAEQTQPRNSDPIEPINRAFWAFNWDFLDRYLLRPVTVGYINVMPKPARTGLRNAVNNLDEPANVVNNLLQGKAHESAVSLTRFILNSTVGLLGTIDVAKHFGLNRERENFGEVLGVWGADTGPYLMLPFLGPSDVRSFSGDVVDNIYFPVQDVGLAFNLFRIGISAIENRAQLMEQEQLVYDAVDPYALVREIYFQNLEFRVYDGNVPQDEQELEFDDELDDFLDDLDIDEDGGSSEPPQPGAVNPTPAAK